VFGVHACFLRDYGRFGRKIAAKRSSTLARPYPCPLQPARFLGSSDQGSTDVLRIDC
jgi:hypothetical protein